MTLESRLLDLKKKIKQEEHNLIEAKANLKTVVKALKDEFSVTTEREAEKLLKDLTQREAKLATKIENAISDIENRYEASN